MSDLIKWMERLILPALIIIFSIVYFVSRSDKSVDENSSVRVESNPAKTDRCSNSVPEKLQRFYTKDTYGVKNTEAYIEHVINHGSYWLKYKGGVMEGGYISPKDAHMVACYVVHLSGRECKEGYPKEAEMYFSSVCAGCHENDGKGLHGNYPDLTKKELDGLQRIYKQNSSSY